MSRGFLTDEERQRLRLYPKDISSEEVSRFFTLTIADLEIIRQQRTPHSQLGFALQLCTLRYLGFIPNNLLEPPPLVIRLLAYQLDVPMNALQEYGMREQTRSDHLNQIMDHLAYRRLSRGELHTLLEEWLVERALEHDKPTFLLNILVERLRWERILRPGLSILERLVATVRNRAYQIIYQRVSPILTSQGTAFFQELLETTSNSGRTKLRWLQQLPNDHTASQIKTTLRKIHFLQGTGISQWDLSKVNPNRLKTLANIGSRATNQQLERTSDTRRYPILIAFLKQSLINFTDLAIDLFDACLWQKHVEAKAELDEIRLKAARSTNEKLKTFNEVLKIVVNEEVADADVRTTIFKRYQSEKLQTVVQETENLIRPDNDEAIDLFAKRYGYLRRFVPQFLTTLTFQSHDQNNPLLSAIEIIKGLDEAGKRPIPSDAPLGFVNDTWREYVVEAKGKVNRRYYELAMLWQLRLALHSGDIFVQNARRYADTSTYLIPIDSWQAQRPEILRLTTTPQEAESRLREREAQIEALAHQVEKLLTKEDSGLRNEAGTWVLTQSSGEPGPERVERLGDAIAEKLPRTAVTDLFIEVANWSNIHTSVTHASSGLHSHTPRELQYLYAAILSQGCNHSLAQMSRSSGLPYHRLVYASNWFLREETLKQANTVLVNYHHSLDVSHLWGTGVLSSSDGQRLPITGKNRKARSIKRYFGYGRGVTFYTWTSDQFSLYGSKAIASTVRDATYVLDEILANETELPILEHTTDTAGYTEIVFALFDLLGLTFTPRIKDLASQQLYRTNNIDLENCPQVKARLSKRANIHLIVRKSVVGQTDNLTKARQFIHSKHI